MANEAQAKLGISTSQAIAELNAVIAKAREAHAATRGLPPPAVHTAQSPLLPPSPPRHMPGGKASELAGSSTRAGDYSQDQKRGAKAATDRAHQPATATEAANSRARAIGPARPTSLRQSGAVSAAADMANGQGVGRLDQALTNFKLGNGGVQGAGFKLGANGIETMSAMRLLGPTAAYAGVAMGGVRTMNDALDVERSILAEMRRSGRNPTSIIREQVTAAIDNKAASIVAGAETFAGALREGLTGLTESNLNGGLLGWLSPIGAVSGLGARILGKDAKWVHDKNTAAAESVANFVRRRQGRMSIGDERRIGLTDATTKWIAGLNAAEEHAAGNASRVARQLWGRGFGTREELEDLAVDAQELKSGVSRDRVRQLVREGTEINGKQE